MGTNPSLPANATPVWIAPAPGQQTFNITAEHGDLIKTGPGVIQSISVNQAQADGLAEIVDGLNGAGTVLGTVNLKNQGPIALGWNFTVGLFVITTGSGPVDISVNYL